MYHTQYYLSLLGLSVLNGDAWFEIDTCTIQPAGGWADSTLSTCLIATSSGTRITQLVSNQTTAPAQCYLNTMNFRMAKVYQTWEGRQLSLTKVTSLTSGSRCQTLAKFWPKHFSKVSKYQLQIFDSHHPSQRSSKVQATNLADFFSRKSEKRDDRSKKKKN